MFAESQYPNPPAAPIDSALGFVVNKSKVALRLSRLSATADLVFAVSKMSHD